MDWCDPLPADSLGVVHVDWVIGREVNQVKQIGFKVVESMLHATEESDGVVCREFYYEEIIFRMYILRIAPLNFTLIGY
jgi:hypothetical protein